MSAVPQTINRRNSGVREFVQGWVEAWRAKDAARIVASYAADVETFDLVAPLRHSGASSYRAFVESFLADVDGALLYDLEHVEVAADERVAFVRGLYRLAYRSRRSGPVDNRLRATLGLKRMDGHWRIVHQHFSVPIDMESGRGLTSLER